MKTLDRYIAKIFIKNLLMAVLSMTVLFLFQAILADLFNQNYSSQQVVFYHLMSVPQIFVQMAPPAVLMAAVLTLSGLARTHELIACYAIGFGLRRIMTIVLITVATLSLTILLVEDSILPPLFRIRTNYYWKEMQKHSDFFLDIKRDKIWYRSNNMIYNLQRFDNQSKTIFGMSVYTFDDSFNLIQMVGAEKAEFTETGWKLLHGTITIFSKESPFPLTQDFKEKQILISETPKDFQEIEKEVDGLKIKELHQYIQTIKNAGADTKSYEVKLHSRFSLSFIPIVMCFLAVPFSVGNRREGGLAKDLGLCLGTTFLYWLFYSISLSLGVNGVLPPWLAAWLPSATFLSLAMVLISRKQ